MFKKLAILTFIMGIPYSFANSMAPTTSTIKVIPNSSIEVEIVNKTSKNFNIDSHSFFPWYSDNFANNNLENTQVKAGEIKSILIKPIYETPLYADTNPKKLPLKNFIALKSEDYNPNPFTGSLNGLDFRIDTRNQAIRIGLLDIGSMGWKIMQQQLASIPAAPFNLKAQLIIDGKNAENSSFKLLTTQPASLKDLSLRSIASRIRSEGIGNSKAYAEAYDLLPADVREELDETIVKVGGEDAAAAEKDVAYW